MEIINDMNNFRYIVKDGSEQFFVKYSKAFKDLICSCSKDICTSINCKHIKAVKENRKIKKD